MKYKREELIQKIYDMRIKEHKTVSTCIEYLKSLGYKRSTCFEIVAATRDKITKIHNDNNKNVLEHSIEDMEKMLEQAVDRGDHKLALEYRKELNRIQGLYIERINHTGNVDTKVTIIKLKGPNGDVD